MGGDASQHDFSEFVLHHLPDHPSPLDVLVARVDSKGPYPIRNLVVSTTNFRPTAISMNGEDPEIAVRSPTGDLIPLKAENSAVFTCPDVEGYMERDKLAVWFTDDEDRKWKKDVHGVTTRQEE